MNWNWLKNLWSNLLKGFKKFIDIALPIASKLLISEFTPFAINAVSSLDFETISNEEKRKKAFDAIKSEAVSRGKNLSSSLVNVLIELSLQYIRNI